jgi:hypothetical protein
VGEGRGRGDSGDVTITRDFFSLRRRKESIRRVGARWVGVVFGFLCC